MKFKKGDKVVLIAGKDKGKKGEVIRTFVDNAKVLVSEVNIAKKHVKPSQQMPQGGIVSKEMPIAVSNVAHVDPKTDKPTKVGYKTLDDGKKVRYAKKSGEILDNA